MRLWVRGEYFCCQAHIQPCKFCPVLSLEVLRPEQGGPQVSTLYMAVSKGPLPSYSKGGLETVQPEGMDSFQLETS